MRNQARAANATLSLCPHFGDAAAFHGLYSCWQHVGETLLVCTWGHDFNEPGCSVWRLVTIESAQRSWKPSQQSDMSATVFYTRSPPYPILIPLPAKIASGDGGDELTPP